MFESRRDFKIWDYNVSHKQLLLRSPRTGANKENIDVIFWDVEFVSIPSVMQGIAIRTATEEEQMRFVAGERTASKHQTHTYRILSESDHGFVIASGCKVLKNILEIFDSSLVYFDHDRPVEEYGDVLMTI